MTSEETKQGPPPHKRRVNNDNVDDLGLSKLSLGDGGVDDLDRAAGTTNTTTPITDLFQNNDQDTAKTYAPSERFQKELKSSPFCIFHPLADLGFFEWKPNMMDGYKSMASIVSAIELRDQVHCSDQVRPAKLADYKNLSEQLPKTFVASKPSSANEITIKFKNEYPFRMPHVMSLHVATVHCQLNLNNIDFCFGGSGLGMLANQETPNDDGRLIGYTFPHQTNVIMVAKAKNYVKDLSDFGFQFENFVTGGSNDENLDGVTSSSSSSSSPEPPSDIEHLSVMEIKASAKSTNQSSSVTQDKSYTILFSAEVDAMHPQETHGLVEITCGNPRYHHKKMFQMVSSGSTNLCAGTKHRDRSSGNTTITHVELIPLSKLMRNAKNPAMMEANILKGLNALKEEARRYKPGEVFDISFRYDGTLATTALSRSQSRQVDDSQLSTDIIQDLFTKWGELDERSDEVRWFKQCIDWFNSDELDGRGTI